MDIVELYGFLIKPRHPRPEGNAYSLSITGTVEKPKIVMRNSVSQWGAYAPSIDKRCGAHSRSTGKPCCAMALANGRCRNHGGVSTGPKTPEGKARALANLKQYQKAN